MLRKKKNAKSKMLWLCVPDHQGAYLSPPLAADSGSLCSKRQPVTSFPALLARQRASVAGKLVCAGVFSGLPSEQGRQEGNVASPQIRFPLGITAGGSGPRPFAALTFLQKILAML